MSDQPNPYATPLSPAPTEAIDAVTLKLNELGLQLNPAIDYQLDTLFPKTSGMGHKADIKARHKMLSKLDGFLQHALLPGEQVQYVGLGTQNKLIEQYFLGAIFAALINKTQFVLTNLRVLMVHADARGNPTFPMWAVYYNQIAEFKKSLLGEMRLQLADGTKFKYGGFKGADRKQMPLIVEQARQDYVQTGFQPQVTQPRENLCTRCYQVVPAGQLQCPHCGQQFWKPMDLALRSLIFPSWGDFLIKHYLIATMELIGYGVSWMFYLFWIAAAFLNGNGLIAILGVAALLILQHAFDALITYFIAKKGLSPK